MTWLDYLLLTFINILLFSAFIVISTVNAIYALIALIFVFVATSILLLWLGLDYLALLFLIIYVGAITVLFLFIIMMTNTRNQAKKTKMQIIAPILFTFLLMILTENLSYTPINVKTFNALQPVSIYKPFGIYETNLELIGHQLFTSLGFHLLIIAFILLVTLIGVVQIAYPANKNFHKQNMYYQMLRQANNTVKYKRTMGKYYATRERWVLLKTLH